MASRRPVVFDDDWEIQELQDGDTLLGGSLPPATGVGQFLIAVDGVKFTPTLWLVDDNGCMIVDDDGLPVTDD